MRQLSMLKSIQAFEATARHQSYIGAAAELGVTPAAIGQHVRALESYTGQKLFKRTTSGTHRLALTERGAAALQDFNAGLERMAAGMQKLRRRTQSEPLVVTASHSFMTCWLLPRLPSFFVEHPGADIRLDVNDRVVEIENGEADVGLRFGPGTWRNLEARKLMEEEMFPVCSPLLKRRIGRAKHDEILRTQVLIEDASLPNLKIFPAWDAWLGRFGIAMDPSARRLKISSSAAVVQAAVAGQGIALARRAFVSRDLSEGRLVRMAEHGRWRLEWSYFAVFRTGDLSRPAVRDFVAWAERMAQADGGASDRDAARPKRRAAA